MPLVLTPRGILYYNNYQLTEPSCLEFADSGKAWSSLGLAGSRPPNQGVIDIKTQRTLRKPPWDLARVSLFLFLSWLPLLFFFFWLPLVAFGILVP